MLDIYFIPLRPEKRRVVKEIICRDDSRTEKDRHRNQRKFWDARSNQNTTTQGSIRNVNIQIQDLSQVVLHFSNTFRRCNGASSSLKLRCECWLFRLWIPLVRTIVQRRITAKRRPLQCKRGLRGSNLSYHWAEQIVNRSPRSPIRWVTWNSGKPLIWTSLIAPSRS